MFVDLAGHLDDVIVTQTGDGAAVRCIHDQLGLAPLHRGRDDRDRQTLVSVAFEYFGLRAFRSGTAIGWDYLSALARKVTGASRLKCPLPGPLSAIKVIRRDPVV